MNDNEMKMGYGVSHTVEETARHLGISRQRVMMIERNALLKLRKLMKREFGAAHVYEML